mmetsp:Transcript_66028/g.137566  ORF Transcript_66028/g.137566 Transcript_66028/m.137566 type:complete len:532 (+) Transcript_66028:198-1793(+)|eukprot:CAMPEP_0181331380 /NCGR_PEP_ID=MMETSP1101-20121128/24465_1 /TAXON_ID=46948 /ORGANISM="Rhodomonas abbreviata, Strain Caron Lab Isolate" /LENGTH=531 /DNA_ID=CAMNT_0023440825 /DNA_START=192 /DNA_END=1787 /DNA_ORIENTATION=+
MGNCASGAQNAFAFAAAVEGGHIPDVSTLTYQGVFNEHLFYAGEPATGIMEATSFPIMKDGKPWLAIYLKSLLDGQPRDATPIDLSVVIDVSGSMSCGMSNEEGNACGNALSRLDCAKRAVSWLVKEVLRPNDRIALSTFNNTGHRLHGLTELAAMDKERWLEACDTLTPSGGTTLCAGMEIGREAFGNDPDSSSTSRTRRILFLTDMQEMGAGELGKDIAKYAAEDVFVGIVGMGVEFNADLTDTVTKNKGSIYSSATNVEELRQIIVDDFDFNSFPAAFDVSLSIRSGDLDVEAVYGTPFDHSDRADLTVGWSEDRHQLYAPESRAAAESLILCSLSAGAPLPMDCVSKVISRLDPPRQSVTEVNTFFPGRVTDSCIKGGLVLVQLAPKAGGVPVSASSLELTLEYTDRAGKGHTQTDPAISFATPYMSGSLAGQDARIAHGLEKGLQLHAYCQICREHMELASSTRKEQLGDVEDVCVRLEQQLGEVKATLSDQRFLAFDAAMADKLCHSADAFIESFASAVGREPKA